MRVRIPTLLISLLIAAMVLVACDSGDPVDVDDPDAEPDTEVDDPESDPDPDADADDQDDAPSAEGGTLVAAIGGDPDQLDPHTTTSSFAFTVLENVYDTLVQPASDLTMEPALAESWDVSDDLLTWTFNLRQDVTFHDGTAFTAEDVVASFERIAEEGENAFRLDAIEEYVIIDDHTVEFELSRVAPNLLEQIGPFAGLAIAPAAAIEAGTLADEPVGTGAFQFVSFTPGDSVELERNPDYWGGDVPLDGIRFQVIPDEGVKLTSLETGEVDWIDSVPPEQVDGLADRDEVELGQVAGNDYWYLALNNDREPFDDERVRRAIAFALDIDVITEAAQFDAATPNETAIPETSFWHHDYAPFGHDPAEAEALLEEAGVSDLSIDLMVSGEFPETVTAAQIIESQLGQIGIEVQIRDEDFSTWLADQGEGDFDAFALGWLGNIDPDDFYYAQHHSEGAFNFHGFNDDEVDALLDEARTETDEDARKGLYDAAAERIVDLASYIYFYNPDIVTAWGPDVQGYEVAPHGQRRFNTVSLDR
jgi:peptide/nickel transport system substrate-binding protein